MKKYSKTLLILEWFSPKEFYKLPVSVEGFLIFIKIIAKKNRDIFVDHPVYIILFIFHLKKCFVVLLSRLLLETSPIKNFVIKFTFFFIPVDKKSFCLFDRTLSQLLVFINLWYSLHGKPNYLFPDVLKRLHWNMIFLVLSGKMIFLFTENMILPLGRKMKDDLFQKLHRNMIFSADILKRWHLQKNCARALSFLYYQGRWYFFPEKMIFFFGRKMKDHISQEISGNTIFSVYTCRCYKRGTTAFCQKNQRQPSPAKIHLKVIDTLDWYPRKS